MTKVVSLGRENGHITVVVTLMEAEWSCYGGGQFKRGRMVMLQRQTILGGMVIMEVASSKEGEWSCYRGGHFNAGSMVMLQRWLV